MSLIRNFALAIILSLAALASLAEGPAQAAARRRLQSGGASGLAEPH